MEDNATGNGLLEINVNTGTITNLGSAPEYPCHGDLTLFNGEVYYNTRINNFPTDPRIVKFSLSDPTNVTLVMQYSNTQFLKPYLRLIFAIRLLDKIY